ncbi:MAG: hypothetical protein K0S42_21 [Microvirga sp.]|jgi:hypothetical protein|nr:hypothetical protein [Microvirga sp.]
MDKVAASALSSRVEGQKPANMPGGAGDFLARIRQDAALVPHGSGSGKMMDGDMPREEKQPTVPDTPAEPGLPLRELMPPVSSGSTTTQPALAELYALGLQASLHLSYLPGRDTLPLAQLDTPRAASPSRDAVQARSAAATEAAAASVGKQAPGLAPLTCEAAAVTEQVVDDLAVVTDRHRNSVALQWKEKSLRVLVKAGAVDVVVRDYLIAANEVEQLLQSLRLQLSELGVRVESIRINGRLAWPTNKDNLQG